MGVSSCTGPIGEELQAIMLIINEGELTVDSSILSGLQDSISIEYLHWEE